MFAMVAVVAAFFAYHVNWIRERHKAILKYPDYYAEAVERGELPPYESKAPMVLRWFGEPGRDWISMRDQDLVEQRRLQRLFPEATVDLRVTEEEMRREAEAAGLTH
jgi:hypothetical protein